MININITQSDVLNSKFKTHILSKSNDHILNVSRYIFDNAICNAFHGVVIKCNNIEYVSVILEFNKEKPSTITYFSTTCIDPKILIHLLINYSIDIDIDFNIDNFNKKYVFVYKQIGTNNINAFKLCELSKLYCNDFLFNHITKYIDNNNHINDNNQYTCCVCHDQLSVNEIIYYDKHPEIANFSSYGKFNCKNHWCECMSDINKTPWKWLNECSNCCKFFCKTCKGSYYDDLCENCMKMTHDKY